MALNYLALVHANLHDTCLEFILKQPPCSAVAHGVLPQALFACHGQRWLCPCRACPAQVAGVGTVAEPAAESQHRKSPISSAYGWDFPFEIQPLTLSATVLFLGFLKRVSQ